jgi:hypothetical protein
MGLYREFIRLFLVVFLFVLPFSIYAENSTLTNLYFSAETGWSAMAHNHVSPYQFKGQKNLGYRFSMGYLFPLPNQFKFGPEIGFGYYGKISYENQTKLVVYYKSFGWSTLANLSYKMRPKIDLALKGGVTEVIQHYDIVGPKVTRGGFYQRAFSPTLILASSYSFSKHISLALSYTHIFAHHAPLTSDPKFTYTNVNQICSINAVMAGFNYSV